MIHALFVLIRSLVTLLVSNMSLYHTVSYAADLGQIQSLLTNLGPMLIHVE